MTQRTLPLLTAAAALLAAGCGSNYGSDYSGMGGTETVTRIVATEIATNTGEDTTPILLNDLPISTSDSRDNTEPSTVY